MRSRLLRWAVLLVWSMLSSITIANQIQYYNQNLNYGLALTSTFGNNDTEVIIQLTAPASYGWAAVGTGAHMEGSIIFIIYPSGIDNSVTLSVRQAKDHLPIPTREFQISLIESSNKNGIMSAVMRWKGAEKILGGKLDLLAHKQALIWAVGPNQQILSTDPNFNILKHEGNHGVIFADMGYAQNPSSAKPVVSGTKNMYIKAQPEIYRTLVIIHAMMLCTAFVIVFPLGVIGLRWNWGHGFAWHWMFQAFGLLGAFGGMGVAIAQSIVGIVHDSFNQPHQLIGLGVCSLLALQAWFGYAQHQRNKVYKKWTWASWWHILFGRVLIYGGMANAALGFLLVGLRIVAIAGGAICLVIAVILEVVTFRALRRTRRTKQKYSQPTQLADYHKLQDVTVTEGEIHPQGFERVDTPKKKKKFHLTFGHRKHQSV